MEPVPSGWLVEPGFIWSTLMIKAVFLDFDGTLVNSAPGIVKTMEMTFREMNLPVPSESAMRGTIGMPLRKALQVLGNLSTEDVEVVYDTYARLCRKYEIENIVLFPKVAETLAELHNRGIRLAIATSRDAGSTELVARNHHIYDLIETKVAIEDHLTPKPAPDMVLALLERMQLKKDEVIVIGDTTFDIDMGNSAGCETIAVTYGNHARKQLMESHPTHIIDSFDELMKFV